MLMNGVSSFDLGWTLLPFLLLLAMFVGGILLLALALWILYTVIWNAVVRGLEEYHGDRARGRPRRRREPLGTYLGFVEPAVPSNAATPPVAEQSVPAEQPMTRDRGHRSGRLTR
jgi:hypothetical protein